MELEPGSYTILWVYSKQIFESYPQTKNFRLKIKNILVEGVDATQTECKKCDKTSTTIRCKSCPENYYFDESRVNYGNYINILDVLIIFTIILFLKIFNILFSKISCIQCPDNTYSEKNSIGYSSCKSKRLCNIADADYFEENYFLNRDLKFYYEANYKLNPLSNCDSSKLNELEAEFRTYPTLYSPTGFDNCKDGLCLKKYNISDFSKFVCTPCDENKYKY